MKVVITGGGTGGHVYPAIAIADRIVQRSNDAEILFIGTEKGIENDIVPKNGYPIKFITISGLNRRSLIKNVKVAREYLKAKKQTKKILSEFKPDLVIGTGGYVCGPVVKVASKLGIPCYIHEQNATPGITNRALEKSVKTVFLGFEEAGKVFKNKEKHVVSGNPVRDIFFKMKKPVARENLKIGQDEFLIFIFGGSQGAAKINKAAIEMVEKYNGKEGVRLVFVTGKRYFEPVETEMKEKGIEIEDNVSVVPYIDDMHLYIPAADVVVSRSGALTVSEITVSSTPSILIPSPNVAGNHQMFNAKAVADKGGAIILEESQLSGEKLAQLIEDLRNDRPRLEEMSKKARACAPLDASDIIYYNILNG